MILRLAFLSLFLFSSSLVAQTQNEMNATALKELKSAEAALEQINSEILFLYKEDQSFINAYQTAEKAWVSYRDAYLEMIFPGENKTIYGSVYPMVWAANKTGLIKDHCKTLSEWLSGGVEGDVSRGSVKTTDQIKEIEGRRQQSPKREPRPEPQDSK